MAEAGGLVVDTGGELRFVPADIALSIVPEAQIVSVPGLEPPAVGLTLADDRAVTVLRIGGWPPGELILCKVDGVAVLLTGAKVLASGQFPSAPGGGVTWGERAVTVLDVRQLLLRAEAAIWEARAVHDEARRT